jgi:methionyl-tRNA formyltransferase
MHPTKFDHGVVLAQTPAPGVEIGEADTPQSLLEKLGPLGAEMLVRGIEENLFVPPHHDVCQTLPAATQQSHAPKISPSDREIDWKAWDADEIVLRDRVLGRLWDGSIWARTNLDAGKWEGKQKNLRATFTGPWHVASAPEGVEAGTPFLCTKAATGVEEIRFATRDGKAVVPTGMTQESGRKDQGLGLLVEQIKEHEE